MNRLLRFFRPASAVELLEANARVKSYQRMLAESTLIRHRLQMENVRLRAALELPATGPLPEDRPLNRWRDHG